MSLCLRSWCLLVHAVAPLLAFGLLSCAPQTPPVVRRLGPALCKEGPPSWKTSDGRQLMYRTWGPSHKSARAVIVGVPGWNGTAGDMEPLGNYLARRGI